MIPSQWFIVVVNHVHVAGSQSASGADESFCR